MEILLEEKVEVLCVSNLKIKKIEPILWNIDYDFNFHVLRSSNTISKNFIQKY